MEELSYEQVRTKALREGVKDTKLHIGMWANFNGYMKTKRKICGKIYTRYIVLQKLSY